MSGKTRAADSAEKKLPGRPSRFLASLQRLGAWLQDALPLAVIIVISFTGSFEHIITLATAHHQTGVEAKSIAGVLDLLCFIAARERQRDRKIGRVKKWGIAPMPTVILTAGIGLTMAENLAEAQISAWGLILAGTPSAVLLTVIALLERRASFAGTARRSGSGNHGQNQAAAGSGRTSEPAPGNQQPGPGTGSGNQAGTSTPTAAPGPAPAAAPAASRRASVPRSIEELQREALDVVTAYRAETGERINNAELAKRLAVAKRVAGEIRKQISDREDTAGEGVA